MKKQPPSPKKELQDNSVPLPAETNLEPSGVIVVERHSTPPDGPANQQIHPRRPLPLVPEAPEEEHTGDHDDDEKD